MHLCSSGAQSILIVYDGTELGIVRFCNWQWVQHSLFLLSMATTTAIAHFLLFELFYLSEFSF